MIPPNVLTKLEANFHGGHSAGMLETRSNIRSANNIVRHSAARMFDEPTAQQARSIDKILRLPK